MGIKSIISYKQLAIILVIIIAIVILSILFLIHSSSPEVVKVGDNVSVFYTLRLANGTIIQSNFNSSPFSFIVGSNQVITGFSNAVVGMKVGQVKNVTIPPNEAYGYENSSLIITLPISVLGNKTYKVGTVLYTTTGLRGVIDSINSTNLTINFNSPLAGQTLYFTIKLVSVNNKSIGI